MTGRFFRKHRATLMVALGIIAVFSGVIVLPELLATSGDSRETKLRKESGLNSYRIIERKVLSQVLDNLSGVTYSRETNSLFAIVNTPPTILELDLSGKVLRTILLIGFYDTEGIAHMNGNFYSIVEERLRRVSFIELSPTATQIDASQWPSFRIRVGSQNNEGLEGIGWSPSNGLFVAHERNPKQIFKFPQHSFSSFDQINSVSSWTHFPSLAATLPINDISGLHIQEDQRRLLVLSDESHRLLEMSFDGTISGELTFNIDPFGFFNEIDQPEGVTMDSNERIYVVGEPNVLIILDKAKNAIYRK